MDDEKFTKRVLGLLAISIFVLVCIMAAGLFADIAALQEEKE